MSRFLNEKYASLEEYVPGEQPQNRKYIKLNTNESPFPPSKGVIDAVNFAEVNNLNLYSDPTCRALKNELAKSYGVTSDNIFVSNGSDDILNLSFMAFCGGKTGAAFPEISYGFYKVYADLYKVDYKAIPLNQDFSINPADYFGLNRFIVIANPNAPTGISLKISDIELILEANPDNIVLIDEAYVDFGADSCYKLVERYKNLLVVMTFSKSRSLAGARLGFAIGDADIINDLEKLKFSTNPYSINRLTLVAGIAALKDSKYYDANCKTIIITRQKTVESLKKLGFNVLPSSANFIFASTDLIDGGELYLSLKERGILIRHFTDDKISNFVRITIGTDEQMDAFITATADIINRRINL